ncbi:hypothetical protein [Breoghania sp.]|uniref:hypothetical protein n=1 Tax=Breoghania sp. TaxID=2065378 RepID=UPI002AA93F3F|nr:hypothetical protein [Breoghania sp.]
MSYLIERLTGEIAANGGLDPDPEKARGQLRRRVENITRAFAEYHDTLAAKYDVVSADSLATPDARFSASVMAAIHTRHAHHLRQIIKSEQESAAA